MKVKETAMAKEKWSPMMLHQGTVDEIRAQAQRLTLIGGGKIGMGQLVEVAIQHWLLEGGAKAFEENLREIAKRLDEVSARISKSKAPTIFQGEK